MGYPRLMAVVTALTLLSGAGAARAEYSLAQLQVIESLISAQNWQALYEFIQANPAILVGDDPLVRELRAFLEAYDRGESYDFAVIDDKNPVQTTIEPAPPSPPPIY
jgi:hypothetical protein